LRNGVVHIVFSPCMVYSLSQSGYTCVNVVTTLVVEWLLARTCSCYSCAACQAVSLFPRQSSCRYWSKCKIHWDVLSTIKPLQS